MTNQHEVERRARAYIRRTWPLEDKDGVEWILHDPRFHDTLAYRSIVFQVALDGFKAALVASLPRWLRRLFEEAR